MLLVISPAKSLDFETPAKTATHNSQPDFLDTSEKLIAHLKKESPQRLQELMGISDNLAELNAERYQAWQKVHTAKNAKPAILSFTGDVYQGLEATSFSEADFAFAQQHLRVLSGLYGLLRPLDLIQPYRLEMGTNYSIEGKKNLYGLWKEDVTAKVNQELSEQPHPTLINLASNEYFKAIDKKKLQAEIITPVFKDWKNGTYKVISFFAKKARGMMARFIIQNQLEEAEGLKAFTSGGYGFNAELSKEKEWVFTRDA